MGVFVCLFVGVFVCLFPSDRDSPAGGASPTHLVRRGLIKLQIPKKTNYINKHARVKIWSNLFKLYIALFILSISTESTLQPPMPLYGMS